MTRTKTGARGHGGAKQEPSTRERLLAAAIRLFQSRGYDATGVADILVAARAPKGSLYHHFPRGKEQIAEAAIRSIASDVDGLIAKRRASGATASEMLRAVAGDMATWLERTGWREGGLLAALAQAAPRAPRLRAAVRRAYGGWRTALGEALAADGIDERRCADLAWLAIATLEGGLVLARVERRGALLRAAAEDVARLLETSAAEGRSSTEDAPPGL